MPYQKMIKSKASNLLRQIISMVCSIARAKSMAIKTKTSAAKARCLVTCALMKNKKALMMGSISNKINSLLGTCRHHDHSIQSNAAIVLFNANADADNGAKDINCSDDHVHEYPDQFSRALVDEGILDELEAGNKGGISIIEQVKNSKEEGGEEFSLEDDIDHVADLFITRFHKQMRMQKLLSFKRYQQMLERSV